MLRSSDYARKVMSHIRAKWLDQSTAALVREAVKRGIPWRRIGPETCFAKLGYGRLQKTINETVSHHTSSNAVWISHDKAISSRLLAEIGLPVPRQSVLQIAANNADAEKTTIAAADKVGYPVVVKPMSRRKGLGISVDVKDAAGVRRAVTEALVYENSIIIESFIPGDDHRLLIVGGKMIAAAKRIPDHVIGDGRQSVSELVGEVNQDPRRGKEFEALLVHLELNSQAKQLLAGQGLSTDQVPPSGQIVYVCKTANISTGGTATDVTDKVHPDNMLAAVRTAATLGLDVAGIDFLSPDISRSYKENGAAICEVNSSLGKRPHWIADKTRDVVGPMIDAIYPPGAPSLIPITAITGTSGKTTTTRMAARILEQSGQIVDFATSDVAYIGREMVVEAIWPAVLGRTSYCKVLKPILPCWKPRVAETLRAVLVSIGAMWLQSSMLRMTISVRTVLAILKIWHALKAWWRERHASSWFLMARILAALAWPMKLKQSTSSTSPWRLILAH